MQPSSFGRRLADAITMFVVTAASLLIIVYVGFGEGKRVYGQMQIDKITAQGRILQGSIESYLRAGLPLRQFVGFSTLADPVIQGLDELDAVVVYDESGRQLFIALDKRNPRLPDPPKAIHNPGTNLTVENSETHFQIVIPLQTRFETVGSLVMIASTQAVVGRLERSFHPLLYSALVLSALFSLFVVVASSYLMSSRIPWLQIGYAVTFLTMAGVVVATLVSLYTDGVRSKAQASAFTLGQRFGEVIEFNLRFRDLDGIDKILGDHKHANPEISSAALIIDDVAYAATDPSRQGKSWRPDPGTYAYEHELTSSGTRRVLLTVTIPTKLVYRQVESSVRNFAALFIACGFLAGLFLQVASSLQRLRGSDALNRIGQSGINNEAGLIIVKPLFFIAVFMEHLTYSFLPGFMQDAALRAGLSTGWVSAPFTAFYLCFALSLVPAGHIAERFGPKILIWPGLLVAGLSLLGLTVAPDLAAMTALRAAAGIGQGMLFIGIQAYILAVALPEKKTQGNGIIVFGFQGGMISGMAIGSLLVTYLDPKGVFTLSAALGVLAALYSAFLIPSSIRHYNPDYGFSSALGQMLRNLRTVINNGDFVRTMLCIGIPAKSILTGTITFALPLLLALQGYRQEEIGQIIMLYGIGVVAASGYVSRLVDRSGDSESILFRGAALSGVGLVLVSFMGAPWLPSATLSTAIVVLGVITVGVAHGCINAPVVTHVAHLPLSVEIGANPVTSAYRFLERIGHVAGPFVVGQMFVLWGQTPVILAYIGIAASLLGFIFIIAAPPPRAGLVGKEAA